MRFVYPLQPASRNINHIFDLVTPGSLGRKREGAVHCPGEMKELQESAVWGNEIVDIANHNDDTSDSVTHQVKSAVRRDEITDPLDLNEDLQTPLDH